MLAPANGVINISPQRHFHIDVNNFSNKTVRFLKHMAIAWTAEPPTVIQSIGNHGKVLY